MSTDIMRDNNNNASDINNNNFYKGTIDEFWN